MKALITGINGQDGSYLAELLLDKGYEVHGIVRRNSVFENEHTRVDHIADKIQFHYADLTDASSVSRVVRLVKPDECYHLAAQSDVRISFDAPGHTIDTNTMGTFHVLHACKDVGSKFYFAGSSEMFGNHIDPDGYQREITPMHPVSSYGCTKLFGFHLTKHYRRAYSMHACNGILFNHSSPRRGANFVIGKIVKSAVEIKKGIRNELPMGNLEACRDFGHANDYTRAMWMILQHNVPDDFVVASGNTYRIRDICETVFKILGMNYEDYVVIDPRFYRDEELHKLKGDATRAREILGWKPEYTFESMLDEMVQSWWDKI